jgi:chromosome segregation ATPase
MSSDDLTNTRKNSNAEDKTTQPTITAVFRLLSEMDDRLNGRLDKVESRLDRLETRFDGLETRFNGLEASLAEVDKRLSGRLDELSDQMKNGFLQLSDKIDRSRLHAEADYHDLLRRIRELESRAS